jgi:lipopolysaccharide export system permease protein
MTNGHIVRQRDTGEAPQIVTFESYAIDLDRFEPKGEMGGYKPRERYFSELAYPDPKDPYFRHHPGQFRAEFHERFASPFFPFAFVMIAIAFVGRARSTRQSRIEGVVFAFLLAAAIRLGGLAANNLVVIHASAVPLLYLLPIGGVGLALAFVRYNSLPRGGPGIMDRVADLAGAVRAAVLALLPRPAALRRTRQGAG